VPVNLASWRLPASSGVARQRRPSSAGHGSGGLRVEEVPRWWLIAKESAHGPMGSASTVRSTSTAAEENAVDRRERPMAWAWRPCSGGRRRLGASGATEAIAGAGIGVDDGENVLQIDPSNGSSVSQNSPWYFHIPPYSDRDQ
jgi:hypothetical protein